MNPVITGPSIPPSIYFSDNGAEIGRLWIDKDGFHFEGNADESAKNLFQAMTYYVSDALTDAVLAERERCAKIAEEWKVSKYPEAAGLEIAATIRDGAT